MKKIFYLHKKRKERRKKIERVIEMSIFQPHFSIFAVFLKCYIVMSVWTEYRKRAVYGQTDDRDHTDRKKDRHKDRETDLRTDIKTDAETLKLTQRWIDRHTDR